jgi:hypothetical protein
MQILISVPTQNGEKRFDLAVGLTMKETTISHGVPCDEPQPGQNLKSGLDLVPQ